MSTRSLTVRPESWPVAGAFTISKFSCTTAEVVVVEIADGDAVGRGECERTDAYEPDYPPVADAIERSRAAIEGGAAREEINASMPSGSARNAVDCALWDLESRLTGKPAWMAAGTGEPVACTTVFTISLDAPAAMAEAAARAADRPILKLKLGGEGDLERVAAVHAAAPGARLSVDANEAWTPAMMHDYPAALAELGVEMIEQPLPVGGDDVLERIDCPLPVAADESCRDLSSLPGVVGRYDLVNIKLDKTGGLTGALALMRAAEASGLGLMLGCNLGTSLAMAPAMLIAGACRYVDLDGPLLLERDREPGLVFDGSTIHPPRRELWG